MQVDTACIKSGEYMHSQVNVWIHSGQKNCRSTKKKKEKLTTMKIDQA
jgi:hypothetical protein